MSCQSFYKVGYVVYYKHAAVLIKLGIAGPRSGRITGSQSATRKTMIE